MHSFPATDPHGDVNCLTSVGSLHLAQLLAWWMLNTDLLNFIPKLNKWKLQILNPGQDTARGSTCKGKWFAVQIDLSPRGTLITVNSSEPMIWHSIPSTLSHLPLVIHNYLVRVRLSHLCIWWVVSICDILRRNRSLPMYIWSESNQSWLKKLSLLVLFGEQQFYWKLYHMAS